MKDLPFGQRLGSPEKTGNAAGRLKPSPLKVYGSSIQPVRHCLARLYDAEYLSIPRLLACKFAPEGLKVAAVFEQPRVLAERKHSLAVSVEFEMRIYGCMLLAENPYQQREKAAEVAA